MTKSLFVGVNIILFLFYYYAKTKDAVAKALIVFILVSTSIVGLLYLIHSTLHLIEEDMYKSLAKIVMLLLFCAFMLLTQKEVDKKKRSCRAAENEYLNVFIPSKNNFLFWVVVLVTNLLLFIGVRL